MGGFLGTGINFSIGKQGGAAPVVEAWVDMTSNTYWQAMTGNNWGSWNAGGWWDAGAQGKGPAYYVVLNPLFNTRLWRPTKVRATISPARPEMSFFGNDGDGSAGDRLWANSDNTSHAVFEHNITWDGDAEIDDMNVDADNVYDGSTIQPFYISNQGEGDFDLIKIEFFGFLPS
jgi:hypothetical protein